MGICVYVGVPDMGVEAEYASASMMWRFIFFYLS